MSTNTLMLALAAVLALGVAYLAIAAPSFGGGAYAAGTEGEACGVAPGGGSACSVGPGSEGAGGAGGNGGTSGAGTGGSAGAVAGGGSSGGGNAGSGGIQDIYIRALGGARYGEYDVSEITVKKGVPVRVHFTADPGAGCGRSFVIYGTGVRLVSYNGEEAVGEFTPTEAGTYDYSCSMFMFGPGKLVVV